MEISKIRRIIEKYKKWLETEGVLPKRISTNRTFGDCSTDENLSHALYLCNEIEKFIDNPEKYGKTNRHLTAIQMCLSNARWLTLEDMMNDNKP